MIERERVVVEREHTDPAHDVKPHMTSAKDAPQPPRRAADGGNEPRPIVTPIVQRIERIQEDLDRGQADQPGSRPLNSAVPAQAAPDRASESPVIHVTIGRIEVRATPPPAPAKRVPQPAQSMSLEEYLRSRAGDKR